MTAVFVYTVLAVVAAVFGAFAGRVFAVEAENRLAAIFAGTYVGAGAGPDLRRAHWVAAGRPR